ncbi:MAG: tyrosine phosphatase family protein [Hyphomicrobium sp.]|jgi:predicted protein tyrosine phosphatase
MKARPSAPVHVCALRHIPEVLRQTGASHLVSAINADLAPPTPAGLTAGRHLKLDMHDIIEACDGATAPAQEHVGQLIEFVHGWDREAPLLIHCYAGLSRSTAAAFITLCALNPQAPETAIAQALRRASDTAVPNRRFVSLADAFLRREGRMLAALETMGPNRVAVECIPFGVEAHHGPALAEGTGRAA